MPGAHKIENKKHESQKAAPSNSFINQIGKRLASDQSGNILVIVALGMVALMGISALAIDAGMLYLERRNLQNAVDAAALGGAKELPMDKLAAENQAEIYAQENGIDLQGAGETEADDLDIAVATDGEAITVTASRDVPLYLARVLNFTSAEVSARAVAKVSPYKGGEGVMPLAIPDESYDMIDEGEEFTLKEADQQETPSPGWFYYFFGDGFEDPDDPQGSGASRIKEWIEEDGYPGDAIRGNVFREANGNMSSISEALEDRVEQEENNVIVPIIEETSDNKYWKIVDHASIEIVEVTKGSDGKDEVIAKLNSEDETVSGRGDRSGEMEENGLWATWLAE